jgi:hypothetical protein
LSNNCLFKTHYWRKDRRKDRTDKKAKKKT